jgi:hypothetical protein
MIEEGSKREAIIPAWNQSLADLENDTRTENNQIAMVLSGWVAMMLM